MTTPTTMVPPIFRWAGGKRWLAENIAREINALQPTVYVEPFLGAGAVALNIDAEHYLLGDANDALINLWQQVVAFPQAVYTRTRAIENAYQHTEEGYNAARAMLNGLRREGVMGVPAQDIDALLMRDERLNLAALVLYLLAHGYNGLWRENASGEYNVPFGGSHQTRFKYPSNEQLLALSQFFRGRATFFPTDFEEAIELAPTGAVIYADPPYVGTFDQYTAAKFPEEAQRRLATVLERAARRGAHVFASNAYHPLIHEIYGEWADIVDVKERWSIGSKGTRRGKASCVLIRSRAS